MSLLVAATGAAGEEAKKSLLVEHVPSSVLDKPLAPTNSATAGGIAGSTNGEAMTHALKEPRHELTREERWERFETEFGIRKKDPSLVKGSIESAKYRLDKTVFAADEFVQGVEKTLSFDYELRTLGRGTTSNASSRVPSSPPIPLWDAVWNARLQSDIDLNMTSERAFVGIRLVLPVGN
jgi:hypothetical protein